MRREQDPSEEPRWRVDETQQGETAAGRSTGTQSARLPSPTSRREGVPPVLARGPFTLLHPADSPSRGEHTNQKTFPLFLTRGPGVVIYGF